MANEYGFTGGSKDIANIKNLFNSFFNDKMNNMFPVGSLVITLNNTNPNSLGYPGTWELYSKGQTLVGTNPSDTNFNEPGKSGGEAGAKHTHAIYDTEEWPNHEVIPDSDRVIFADLIDANNPHVLQAESAAASQMDKPVKRLILHSDNSHSDYWRDTDPEGDHHEWVDYEQGKLELRPVWPRTVLNGEGEKPGYNNKITASVYNSQDEKELASMPPYRVVNVWRRKS